MFFQTKHNSVSLHSILYSLKIEREKLFQFLANPCEVRSGVNSCCISKVFTIASYFLQLSCLLKN